MKRFGHIFTVNIAFFLTVPLSAPLSFQCFSKCENSAYFYVFGSRSRVNPQTHISDATQTQAKIP